MSRGITQSLDEEAVAHAYLAEKAGDLSWTHIEAEWTQDVYKIADTLATDVPLAWTLANEVEGEGSFQFIVGTTKDEVRHRYEELRQVFGIHGWKPMLEIRQGWYTLMQGVSTLKLVSGEYTRGETLVMFPVGDDGILGELQIGIAGRLPNGRFPTEETVLPEKRLAALEAHDQYIEALRAENVEQIVAAHSPKVAVAIRSYLTDESSLLNITGADSVREYFTALFERYHVRDVRLVNRMAEVWYVFAELHWIVEERSGAGRTLEFCTGEMSPLGPDGKYCVRNGAGTRPVATA
jgi:predicted SnoaL-like aldol condensation-catalyzing enzyme